MAWQLILNAVRTYAPWVMLPITITVGFIGYNMERWIRNPQSQSISSMSTEERRKERQLRELTVSDNSDEKK